MSILVFGRNGQLAKELSRLRAPMVFLGRTEADLSTAGTAEAAIQNHQPHCVINASAWTAVDAAEDHVDEAMQLNRDAVAEMATATRDLGIPLIHVSTDYVFDGSGVTAHGPEDATAPLGAYGRSKLAGEDAIRNVGGIHAIIRTAWVFSAHGTNFVKTMLRLSETRDQLSIVSDQIGGPTPAADLATACVVAANRLLNEPGVSGTYHLSGVPEVSWADFARAIFAEAGRDVAVTDIPSAAFPTPTERPKNSRLDCTSTERVFGVKRPNWRKGLRAVVDELNEGIVR